MSHFTTIVFTKNPDDLENALAPFHEFECTGYNDQYVQDVDITDEAKTSYQNRKHDNPDLSEAEFIEDWYGLKIVPFGEKPDYKAKHKFGYVSVDADENVLMVVDRTNPNAQWDWYQVGGRWHCYFKPKEGSKSGVQGKKSWGWESDGVTDDWVDVIQKKDIDVEGMRANAINVANETYDKLESVLKGRTLPSWNVFREKHEGNIDAAREEYADLDVVKDLRNSEHFKWAFGDLVDTYCNSREEYVQKQSDSILVPFAFVDLNGSWNERGNMGWWGVTSNEKDYKCWTQTFWDAFNALDDDTWLTLVDCHI